MVEHNWFGCTHTCFPVATTNIREFNKGVEKQFIQLDLG